MHACTQTRMRIHIHTHTCMYTHTHTHTHTHMAVCVCVCVCACLAGLPDNKLNKLQHIQNHAARIVLRKPRHVSATSLLRTLHWLPVKARIQYKIACLCFQCLSHNTMPSYLSDLLHSYQPPRTLRSLDTSLLSVPRFCLETFGRRSFSVFGPTVWNSLPLPLRKTQCFSTFKTKLKTHLFEKHLS